MRLSQILNDIVSVPADADCEISRLMLDSRKVTSGDLFFAINGTHLDGRHFVADAISQGASAVLLDADAPDEPIILLENTPVVPVFELKRYLGKLAARFHGYPAKHLRMLGITGTNGKTSCSHFIAQILQSLNIPCGIIGTLGSGFYGALGEVGLTTPDAVTLQATLATFRQDGAKAVAMEVSSHSIDQGRVNDVEFEMGIFTNLTQDHLDYHGDMESYAAVKRRFLAGEFTQQVIINADDKYGKKWIDDLESTQRIYAYTTYNSAEFPSHVQVTRANQIKLSLEGISAVVQTPWGSGEMVVPLIGQFNVSNVLAVLTALCVYGIPFNEVLSKLSKLHPVPGRMQTLGGRGKPLVVVDYAHTPDALEKVLQALRGHTEGKLICVFGCGGDRDPGKRPLMAKMAEQWADQVIVTSDNPRHEDPESIAMQIMQGFVHPERVSVELDRSKAIRNSIQCASAKDCVLIAGKGAEHYQQIGDEKFPFDDVEKVRENLNVIMVK